MRIRDAYEARWKAEKHFNEEAILQELPTALKIEVPFQRPRNFVTETATLLEVLQVVYKPRSNNSIPKL